MKCIIDHTVLLHRNNSTIVRNGAKAPFQTQIVVDREGKTLLQKQDSFVNVLLERSTNTKQEDGRVEPPARRQERFAPR